MFVIVWFTLYNTYGFNEQEGHNTIDYSSFSFKQEKEIALNSDWEFYWNQLITPGNFNSKHFQKIQLVNWTHLKSSQHQKLPSFGFATYRIKFSLDKERPHVSLFVPPIYSSSKIWINGKLISEIGKVNTSRAKTVHRRFAQRIPLNTNETNFEVVIQVANFYHTKAGIDKPLILAPSDYLDLKSRKKIIADMLFIGCLGFIGVFFLLFFFFYWNKDKAILYFGLACVCLSYMGLSSRYAPLADIFPSVRWGLLTKIEYLSLFYAGTAASLFFAQIFINFAHRLYSKILSYGFYTLAFLVIVLPAPYYTKLVMPFLILMIINITYVFIIIIKSITQNRHDSILLLVSMLLGTIVFFLHIFVFLGKNDNAIIYVNFGYVLVFLLLSMLLMVRFSNAFKQLETSRELALQQKKEITKKSDQLSKINLELEQNLRQLKSFNAELDSFNHIVSHDLKAPLVAMHSLVSFIEEDLDTKLDDTAKNHFNLLKDRISKMNALINGLLEYSKVARGEKKKEVFNLNELLTDITSILMVQNTCSINLPDKNIEIFTNKIELEHVFQNLISNAIKYNDKEKTIIDITFKKLANEYIFSVADNGPGISPKYHAKVFEIFSKLNTNDDVESTGIGLSIVKKLVVENQGKITVESEKGLGTKINFTWKI